MPETETLVIERRGRVAIVTFNRPHVLNAFDAPLVAATIERGNSGNNPSA